MYCLNLIRGLVNGSDQMKWYNIIQASNSTGKSTRTIRVHLQKWKEANPQKNRHASVFRYVEDDKGTKRLHISEAFLHAQFDIAGSRVADGLQKQVEDSNADRHPPIDMQTKWEEREKALREYHQKQVEELKQAKNETIEVLKDQVKSYDDKLNKVLEQYELAQITISNLIPSETRTTIQIDDIIEEQQQGGNLTPTKEYMKKYEKERQSQSFSDWLDALDN